MDFREKELKHEKSYVENVISCPFLSEREIEEMKKEWDLIKNFKWYVCIDPVGGIFLEVPAVWIMEKRDFLRMYDETGIFITPIMIFPSLSMSIADEIIGIICRARETLRNLGVLNTGNFRKN